MKVYKFELMDDLDNGDLELLRVCVEDFIKTKIFHLYIDEERGSNFWIRCIVLEKLYCFCYLWFDP